MYLVFFIHSSGDGHLSCFHVLLLWIVLLWTHGCMYLFELVFSVICPGVGLLDHMATLFLFFWGTSILFGTFFYHIIKDIPQWRTLRSLWWTTAKIHIVRDFTGVCTPGSGGCVCNEGGEWVGIFFMHLRIHQLVYRLQYVCWQLNGQRVLGRITCRPNSEFSATIWKLIRIK